MFTESEVNDCFSIIFRNDKLYALSDVSLVQTPLFTLHPHRCTQPYSFNNKWRVTQTILAVEYAKEPTEKSKHMFHVVDFIYAHLIWLSCHHVGWAKPTFTMV